MRLRGLAGVAVVAGVALGILLAGLDYGETEYSDSAAAGFTAQCVAQAGGDAIASKICGCLFDQYKATVPWADFQEFGVRIASGSVTQQDEQQMYAFIEECRTKIEQG